LGTIEIPIKGKSLAKIVVNHLIDLVFEGDLEVITIRIEGQFYLELGQKSARLAPDGAEARGMVQKLIGKEVIHSFAEEDGTLTVLFSDQTQLVVNSDPNYEAWEAFGKRGFRVVCMPGGELAFWK